jgi:hypothetical protein
MRVGLAALGAILVAALVPLAASGGSGQKNDPAADVRAAGLTNAERAALDIRSVRYWGEEGLGLFVLVHFAGNLEQAIGHGHLTNAAVGIVIHPKPGTGQASGLVTMGARSVVGTIRISPTKTLQVTTTAEKDFRHTRSAKVGIVRNRNDAFFFVLGPGFSNVASVEAKSFASLVPGAGRRLAQELPRGSDEWWRQFQKGQPADDEEDDTDDSVLIEEALHSALDHLELEAGQALRDLGPVETDIEKLTLAIDDLGPANQATPGLRTHLQALQILHDQMLFRLQLLNSAKSAVKLELKNRQPPSPPTCKSRYEELSRPSAARRLAAPCFTFTVTKAGNGSGIVTGYAGAFRIDCGARCSARAPGGTTVRLVAQADAGSVFTGWKGCPPSSNGVCQVTLTANKSVTATFTKAAVTSSLTTVCPYSGYVGGTVTIHVDLLPPLVTPITIIYRPPGGSAIIHTVETNSAGSLDDFTPATVPGDWTIQAKFAGTSQIPPAVSRVCTVPVRSS